MIVLALDTTSRAGSAALLRDGVVVQESSGDQAITHVQRLPTELIRLLEAAGVSLADVDLLAVATGPGSFTGLRVGIAAMQGLAVAAGKRIVPVSALEALARAGRGTGALVVPWIDAQRGEVFGAIYDAAGAATLGPPTAWPPAATLAQLAALDADLRFHFIGDGAVRYADDIRAALDARAEVAPLAPRLASFIAALAAESPERAGAPGAVVPLYIRRPDVELVRERRVRPT